MTLFLGGRTCGKVSRGWHRLTKIDIIQITGSLLGQLELKRVRRVSGQTNISHHRNVMVQVDAGSTDTPANSIHVATERPPDTVFRQVKRPAPMNIRGAFRKRSKIAKIT